MDPISALIPQVGESATISTPTGVDPANYDPNSTVDHAAGAPVTVAVVGFPAGKKEIAGMVNGVTSGFTFQATAMPASLVANRSQLIWRGITQRILDVRERSYMGKINGYTVGLAK